MLSNGNNEELEFEILGYKIRFRSSDEQNVDAKIVVEKVKDEVGRLKNMAPHLDTGQAAILVALKMASEKISFEREFKENIDKIQNSAVDALHLIEEASPSLM